MKALLFDELGRAAVVERLVDVGLLRPSEKSGQLVLPEELVRCAGSGKALLPAEVGVCAVTSRVRHWTSWKPARSLDGLTSGTFSSPAL